MYGGPGVDDLLVGGRGPDTVKGGPGNDEVYVDDGVKDIIDCGKGQEDFASHDRGIDTVENCEIRQ